MDSKILIKQRNIGEIPQKRTKKWKKSTGWDDTCENSFLQYEMMIGFKKIPREAYKDNITCPVCNREHEFSFAKNGKCRDRYFSCCGYYLEIFWLNKKYINMELKIISKYMLHL